MIDGLESLESVKIGKKCFRIDDYVDDLLAMLDSKIENYTGILEERDDGICRITNCPNLRQLEIGDYSFEYFQSFELSNLNSIQSIKFGKYCFVYADFSLKGE